ncbi:diacylglycerol/lipid kinase family protein [Salinimicrobium terrae]|uniref:diacylglycerol/lipid kinase family protein n=1 Tax=Salinimicrobium terrae TaxID=470866 RepID=UPI00041F09DC|nr:diacylglycerol kinase family protein [Salinimicrobium terrae]
MKQTILIHNPTAGSGKHDEKTLVKKIEAAGYEVKYYSTDTPGWERFTRNEADVIFLAGGDGTVQKLAAELLKVGAPIQKTPVQVLPLGTANNIATTLNLNLSIKALDELKNIEPFDVGQVEGAGEAGFFIEGLGFGIFPKLLKVMEKKKKNEGEPEDPDDELNQSLQELLEIVRNSKACEAIIIADGEEITGRFLLVELMNIRFIGPNFELAPGALTGDGSFELVAVPEKARKDLESYIQDLLKKDENIFLEDFVFSKKVKKVRFKWFGKDMHIDDERIDDYKGEEIKVENKHAAFNFIVES